MATLYSALPNPNDLTALQPAELAGILLSVRSSYCEREIFTVGHILNGLYRIGENGYPPNSKDKVTIAVAEAVAWLYQQGLVIPDPFQIAASAVWLRFSRAADQIKSTEGFESYRQGRLLPQALLQPYLARKVYHLFLSGDYDTAVFQAFKEIEISVRIAAKQHGVEYEDTVVGRDLMTKAFKPNAGPLCNKARPVPEQEAEMFLFSGAIGHGKNPVSHRHVGIKPVEAARLIVFASHLLDIVSDRLVEAL